MIHRTHDTPRIKSGATYSDCERYRFKLWREWSDEPMVNFLMLNPSTATERDNDPTVERCQRRAERWGYGGLIVTNIFAFRSTDPRGLKIDDPIGSGNDAAILEAATESRLIVCAWGTHGVLHDRGNAVLELLRKQKRIKDKLRALKVGKSGYPMHPLYLPYELEPVAL